MLAKVGLRRIGYTQPMLPFLENVGNYIWSRLWDVADRTFKLAAWGAFIAGLYAINMKHPGRGIGTAAALLGVVWFAAFLVSLFDAGTAFQDKAAEHSAVFKNRWVRLAVNWTIALLLTWATVSLFRGVTTMFAVMLDVAGK